MDTQNLWDKVDYGFPQLWVRVASTVVYSQCVQGRESDTSPQARFLRNANNALQWRSGGSPHTLQTISEEWVVTSFEVDFDSSSTNIIGQGSFGRVYMTGQWNAVVRINLDF